MSEQKHDQSKASAMIEAAFRHHGLEWRYLTIEVDPADLAAAVAGVRAMGFRGFNCTIPHKVAVIEYLDGLGECDARCLSSNRSDGSHLLRDQSEPLPP